MRTFAAPHLPVSIAPAADHDTTAATAELTVVRQHVTGVFRFLRCLGASREEAEDLTQEAFVIAWRKGKQDAPRRALAAFLRRAARLAWLEHRRAVRRSEAVISALALQVWEAEVPDDGDELVAATRACVQRLRGRAATAVDLAYGQGSSREQIATALGMSTNGVKTLLARTRAWIERCIERTS